MDQREPSRSEGEHGFSLDEIHASVATPSASASFLRQYRAFAGPALLIGIGYMDPGNWGTDLQAGAEFRYDLIWVVVLASAMAIVLQIIAARLGVAARIDLAQACRKYLPRWTRIPNWLLTEIAIAACDLAEVLGSAVAINLLFHIPLLWAVLVTAVDVLLLLVLQRFGMRLIEAVALVLVATIAVCFTLELIVLPHVRPDLREIGAALIDPGFRHAGMLTIAIGIIGATIMPHNLYLHSALVQTRKLRDDRPSLRAALRWNGVDAVIALSFSLLINAAILILAAITFNHRPGTAVDGHFIAFTADSDWIQVAYLTLAPLLGTAAASTLFAVALLASGQSSTITGTLAGQVVMEGFLDIHVEPWIRRLITRTVAIVPAIVVISLRGGQGINDLLVLSQIVLALQLPFAMFPMLVFTCRRDIMGEWRNGPLLRVAGWTCGLLITAVDIYGLPAAWQQATKSFTGH